MSYYAISLFAHNVGVIVIFIAIAIEALCFHRMRCATTTNQLSEWLSLTKLAAKLHPLGGVPIMISGLYMSLTAWDLTVPWIGLSLAVMVVMGLVGRIVNSARLEAIATAAATEPATERVGPMSSALARRVQDPVLMASVYGVAALALGVVFLKVARPDLVGSLAALAVAVVAGVLSARLASRGGSVPAEARSFNRAVASETGSAATSDRRVA